MGVLDIFGGKPRESLSQPGIFAGCEDIKDVETFEWPNPDYLVFDETLKIIENASSKGLAVFLGSVLLSVISLLAYFLWGVPFLLFFLFFPPILFRRPHAPPPRSQFCTSCGYQFQGFEYHCPICGAKIPSSPSEKAF